MRIMLINLPIIKFNKLEKEMYNPPLGLLYIASSLEFSGHKVKVIDYLDIEYSRKELFQEIKSWQPKVVGFSIYTENVDTSFKLCRGIKKKYPNIKTVLGGPQASLEPQYCIQDQSVDFVIKNEGESSMLELLEALESEEQEIALKQVTGIVFKENNVLFEDKRNLKILDLDLLAFPLRREEEIETYGCYINLITSRGCPGACIYCAATALSGAKYRVRSIENTILECAYIKAFFKEHLKALYILDDTFTAVAKRVFEFIDLREKFKLNFLWRCESRVDVITEEMVKSLAESKCIGIAFGVESGSQEVLNKIRKRIRLEKVEAVVGWMNKYQIYTSLNFMIGHFCDTPETMNMTYEFSNKMHREYGAGIFTTYNTPFPGTWQCTNMEELGLHLVLSSYSEYSILSPSVEGRNFTVEDQHEVYKKILPLMIDNAYGLR